MVHKLKTAAPHLGSALCGARWSPDLQTTTSIRGVTCPHCLSRFAQLLATMPDPDEDTITATMRVIGARGGQARAAKLTAAERSAIAGRAGRAPKKPRRKRVTPAD